MIRPVHSSDFEFIYSLYFHPEINPFLLYEMMPKAEFKPVFDELLVRKILYIFENEGVEVGMFKLVPMTHRSSHIAYLGGVAIEPRHFGKGLGKLMLEKIVAFALHSNILRIELSVADFNENAIKTYQKTGFVKEGVLKKYTHLKSENRFIDEILMAYVKE